jgi:hypothetical protein
MPLDKLIENVLQRDAVQGIAGMGFEPLGKWRKGFANGKGREAD